MSTESVYVSSASEVDAADVRRREAEAREARRRAAQERAERLAAQAARRRIAAANDSIAQSEAVFNEAVARLDDATRRLPDLAYKVPPLPVLADHQSTSPEAVEAHAQRVTAAVAAIAQQIDVAIAAGKIALQRRLAIAAAWHEIQDRESAVVACAASIAELERRLAVPALAVQRPRQPHADAELETLQVYLAELQRHLAMLRTRYSSLESQANSRMRAGELSGAGLTARAAEVAHDEYEAQRLRELKAGRQVVARATLVRHGLALEQLGEQTRLLIQSAIEEPTMQDRSEQIERWIALEKQHLDGIEQALQMMQRIPDHVHECAGLSKRWSRLCANLQRVANGVDEFLPQLDREYSQIAADAQRNRVRAYTKADWVCAMSRHGFEVLESEEGEGLVVVDLQNPDFWLRGTEMQAEDGGFAVMMELETSAVTTLQQDERITDSVCRRLGEVKHANAPRVQSQGEILARTRRITRCSQPPVALRRIAAPLV